MGQDRSNPQCVLRISHQIDFGMNHENRSKLNIYGSKAHESDTGTIAKTANISPVEVAEFTTRQATPKVHQKAMVTPM